MNYESVHNNVINHSKDFESLHSSISLTSQIFNMASPYNVTPFSHSVYKFMMHPGHCSFRWSPDLHASRLKSVLQGLLQFCKL